MSLSDARRIEAKAAVLAALAELLGDRAIFETHFKIAHEAFKDIPVTTWRELLDEGLVESKNTLGEQRVSLTPYGWLRGIELSGRIENAETRDRCVRLIRGLKKVVKGRSSTMDRLARLDGLATEIGVPWGWVYNALKADLLSVVFPHDSWDARLDLRSPAYIRVSPTFGLNHISD